jgi:hypothetical protein
MDPKKGRKNFYVFERKVLRRIYGPVKDSLTGEWRRKKNTELKTLDSELDILEIIRRGRL